MRWVSNEVDFANGEIMVFLCWDYKNMRYVTICMSVCRWIVMRCLHVYRGKNDFLICSQAVIKILRTKMATNEIAGSPC